MLAAVGLLAATGAPPVGAAVSQARHMVGNVQIHKQVGAAVHSVSLRTLADAVAHEPRPAKVPAISLPSRSLGSSHRSTSPTTSGVSSAKAATTSRSPNIVLTDASASTQFTGIGEVEAGSWTPADPWVAVNASYVVQSVNDMIRVSTRTGTPLLSVPNEAFFSILPGHGASDPRVIWDATHGRWIAEAAYYTADLLDDGLVLAVSDGSDPTAGWTIRPISFGPYLPDFPSLASSGDKIVIAEDVWDSSPTFVGADFNTFRWSEILSGVFPVDHFCTDSNYAHPRAAQVLSSSNDVHLVMEGNTVTGDQWYYRLTNLGDCADFTDGLDMTVGLSMDPIWELGPPPAPRQPGPDTIDLATDGRYTDAVWQNNHLYWVSTFPVTYDGITWNDQVIVWSVPTTTGSGSPSTWSFAAVRPGDTIDAYMGGIGLTRSGIPIVTWSQSSTSDRIAFYAAEMVSPASPGIFGTPINLDTSDGSISGERWGDYAGVAMDPTGTGSVWVTHMLANGDGSWRTHIARILVDGTSPTTPGAPAASTVTSTKLGILPKYKLAWTGSTDTGSGTVSYRLEQNVDSAGFVFAGTLSSTSTTRSLAIGHTYQFRVAAVDPVGNTSAFATGPVLHPSLAQSPTSKSGTWHTSSSTSYSGGSTWYATAAGASATYSTSGLRSIAIVTTKASSRGSFKVYIDGTYKATVSCYSTTTAFAQVVYQYSWSVAGSHSIKIVVVGTSGHPRVDVDAFLILK